MPEGFRFRAGYGGKLVLQRSYQWLGWWDDYGDTKRVSWRDATVEDLNDFFNPKENNNEQS